MNLGLTYDWRLDLDMNLWVAIILSLAIFIVQLILDKLRERSKRPIYYYKTEEIISETGEFANDIQIHFKQEKVARVSITRIGLANVGKEPIDQTDIKNTDHKLKVTFGNGVRILQEPRILKKSRKDIDFQVAGGDKELTLSFYLLDYRDGAVVEVVHTGNKNTKVDIGGAIIGVPKGIIERSYKHASNKVKHYHVVSGSISTALLIFVILKLAPAFVVDISGNNVSWFALLVSLLLTAGLILSIVDHAKQYLRSIPASLSLET
ncbi:MAG: hypothetical protein JW732_03780 [Dehalococcoidia bacterium]|nr:hypothetical protein [Dehalococcoidia bacterium]